MGSIDNGTQTIIWDYKQPIIASEINKWFYTILKAGIYDGGALTIDSGNDILIAPLHVIVETSTNLAVHVSTSTNATLTLTESTPYVTCQLTWADSETNYMDFTAKAVGDILTTDVVIGMGVYVLGTLTSFDYTSKTWGFIDRNGNIRGTGDLTIGDDVFIGGDLTIGSTALVTNLNADMLDGRHTGTSGNTIPILNASNVYSAEQIFSGNIKISNTAPQIIFEDTTSSAYDFRIRADSNVIYIDIDTGSDGTFETSNPIAQVYTGSSDTETDYPIGTIVGVYTNSGPINPARNSSDAIEYVTANNYQFCISGGTGTALSGTWRARGRTGSGAEIYYIFQRVA